MQRPSAGAASPLDSFYLDLKSLEGNGLKEPASRLVSVWWPDGEKPQGLPLLVCLASYFNSGPSLTGWRNFGENLPERLDRLYKAGTLAPVVVVFIDTYNRLGGTQFVNSPVIGNWSDALGDDLVPAIEAKYGCGGQGRRALFGHSSGGYGALYNLSHRPDIWAGAASHAGDCGFDLVYRADLLKTLRVLALYDFDIQRFLDELWQQEKPKGEQVSALMMLAMAGSYDPCPAVESPLGLRLPVNHETGEFISKRWAKWLSFDLLCLDPARLSALKAAKAVYFDCGRQDEYNILYGSRRLHKLLDEAGARHRFEEFDGGHGTIGPRYEISLPWLVEKISKSG